ncbi:MarR family winged helix-turn-helix transcriptional regulator [Cellulomonas chengniuliangii]|uniref:MarR family transcriptional regulator n=1 Tax=Cellulomonas chengniuliangii TaxID=2968084 RepID=A0ABY5KXE0_9CELL|nr:MarR family transcriptional regulator [Cellulomonas chengniuliangii]MCC2308857.1 MarR family transcriptional regulator [Cellulomonas chengniuliangii]UUI74400.1 MarR family transcriptional regulator [Cellulomonas chengniuliangii]
MTGSRQEATTAVGDALQRYQRSVQAYDDAAGRRLGVGPTDLRCLDWLVDEPRTAGQLASATGLRPAATTALIDRLERKGLVERVRSATDRRHVLVQMTDAGRAATWEVYRPLVDEGAALLDRLTVDDLERVSGLLDDLRELTDRLRARLETR